MTAPIILGLVAPSGGGKTTVCSHLKSAHGFILTHVADSLKLGFQVMFGVGPEWCERPLIEEPAPFLGGVTTREFLEQIGTREHQIAPLAMPLRARSEILRMIENRPGARIIVDGIRRETESDMVRALGGHIVRMEGKPVDPGKPCDLSQAEVVADFTLQFTPLLRDLRIGIDAIIEQVMAPRVEAVLMPRAPALRQEAGDD